VSAINDSIASMLADLRDSSGVPAVYRRGTDSVALTVILGRHGTLREEDATPLVMEEDIRDFLLATADLVLDGQAITPETGDQILITNLAGDQYLVHEVLPPPTSGKCYDGVDPAENTLRVHTRQAGAEPVVPAGEES
jgi:hypothetical protein